jgi:predicted ATPase
MTWVRFELQLPRAEDRENLERELQRVLTDRPGTWFVSVLEPQDSANWHVRVEGPGISWSKVFRGPDEVDPSYIARRVREVLPSSNLAIRRLSIDGFGPFASTEFVLAPLVILVGANGSGKTSLFELLRAVRDYTRSTIPPEIIPGWETREVYHRPGPDRLSWGIDFFGADAKYSFAVDLIGSLGNPSVAKEVVEAVDGDREITRLDRSGDFGFISGPSIRLPLRNVRPNQLALQSYVNPDYQILYRLKEQIDSWRFFSGIRFNDRQLRQPALIEEKPTLRDDGGNLPSVLNWLQIENPTLFNELELHLRGIIPGFRSLGVRPSGAGRVTLAWDEDGLVNPLTAADLSDGSLRLLLWLTLALTPNPPALVCIDEPEVGLHPRTLPKLAGLLKKLSDRTQVLVATHSSYLLAQFDVSDVAVLRKRNGSIEFSKPATSAALLANLHEFGAEELELMHRSNELEALT